MATDTFQVIPNKLADPLDSDGLGAASKLRFYLGGCFFGGGLPVHDVMVSVKQLAGRAEGDLLL